MASWIRFYPDRLQYPGERAFVSWTSRSHEGAAEVTAGAYGLALLAALESAPEGFVAVEWDVAYDGCDFMAMERAIRAEPGRPQQAPYLIWPAASWADALGMSAAEIEAAGGHEEPMLWAGRIDNADGTWRLPAEGRDTRTSAFSLGLTWLPGPMLREAAADGTLQGLTFPMADTGLSAWAHAHGYDAGIVWAARPKHLHFDWTELSAYRARPLRRAAAWLA